MAWTVIYHEAFDPERKAMILVAGDKVGVGQQRFYKDLIAKADARFARHIAESKEIQS